MCDVVETNAVDLECGKKNEHFLVHNKQVDVLGGDLKRLPTNTQGIKSKHCSPQVLLKFYIPAEECENAYFKMDNVLIDDRRIYVDFSQSVAKIKGNKWARNSKYIFTQSGAG